MRKNLTVLLSVLLMCFSISNFAQEKPPAQEPAKEQAKEINISGIWDVVTQTPNGDLPGEATFTQEKETLKVSMLGAQGEPVGGEGTIKEGAVQWSLTFNMPNGSLTVNFKGKVDGDKMSGEVEAGDFGTFPWTGTRRKK